MSPLFKNLRPRGVREREFKDASLAYDRMINANAGFVNDTPRTRFGKFNLPVYVDKNKGYDILNEISGGIGGGKGGLLYEDPSPTGTDVKRLIYANQNKVYLYSETNNTRVLLRDIGTLDSYTITFLSGVQTKKNAYFVIGDDTMTAEIYKYSGTTSGAISAFADYSGTVAGTVKVTDVAHGMQTDNTVTIIGTTSYNGTFVITKIDANNFYITDTWVANDATGTWTGETLTLETATGLTDGRYIGLMTDRIVVSGVDDRADKTQYAFLNSSGEFSDFTPSSVAGEGGNLSGILRPVTAFAFTKSITLAFERDRITAHIIDDSLDESTSGLVKDTKTILEELTVSGIGVSSPKAVTMANDLVIFVTEKEGIWSFSPVAGKNRLTELTKKFRPQLENYDFTSASVVHDQKQNTIIVTCSSVAGIGADTLLTYNLDTKTWAVDDGKRTNQVFYDDINEKVFGLSSTDGQVHELFPDSYSNDGEPIESTAETILDPLGDRYRQKRFASLSIRLGAENTSQTFDISIFLDDNETAAFEETVTISELTGASGGGLKWWGGSDWGSSTPSATNQVGYVTYFYDGFLRNFERISVQIKENSSLRSQVFQPLIRFGTTDEKLDSFN